MLFVLSVIALFFSVLGNVLLNYKNKLGYIIWILSNIFWIVINLYGIPNYPQIFMYVVYVVLNIQGFWKWSKNKMHKKLKVITISGKAESGKDFTANLIKKELEAKGQKVLIGHYGDLVKYVCRTFFGWDGEKDEKGRGILQYVGTDVVRKKYPTYWIDFLVGVLKMFYSNWDYVIIPDSRFPNEIDCMKENFNAISIKITRNNHISKLTPEQLLHPSETALDDYGFDYILTNSGEIDELTSIVKELLKGETFNLKGDCTSVLYTTHCPNCKRLKERLDEKNIKYVEFTDADKMIEKGFLSVPMLEVDDTIMNFREAIEWIKNRQEK